MADDQLIIKAKVKLLLKHPFFASLFLKLKFEETDKIPTAATDGVKLLVNPEFFSSLSLDEQIGLLAHEVLHPAFLHNTRRNGRHPQVWNMACDYVINPILLEAGLKLPKDGLVDSKYSGMSADTVYNELMKDAKFIKMVGGSGDGEGGWEPGDGFEGGVGDVMDHPDLGKGEESKEMIEQRQTQDLIAAHQVAKMQGKEVGGIGRSIQEILEPRVDWETYLAQWVSEKAFDDYTWMKPNRRYAPAGFYLPSLENEVHSQIAAMFDTSGSMGQKEIDIVAGELNGIRSIIKSMFHVIYCDSQVGGYQCFEPQDEIDLEVKGGGGTDFVPAFEELDKRALTGEIKAALYFTDGCCNSFPPPPDYPVLWLITPNSWVTYENRQFTPPFGDVVYIDF